MCLHPTHAHKIGNCRALLVCKIDDSLCCTSNIIATADAAFNSFQRREAPLRQVNTKLLWMHCMHEYRESLLCSIRESLWIYSSTQKNGHKLAGTARHTWCSIWHKFFSATALTTMPDPDTLNHSLQCDMLEPDTKHRGAMLRTELAPEWIKSEHAEKDGL